MPYEIQPLLPEHLAYARIWGEQTIEELRKSNAEVIDLLDQPIDSKLHLIIDTSELEKLPGSISGILETLSYVRHPRLGRVVTVGRKNRLVMMIIGILARVAGVRYQHVDTLAEAIDFLQEKVPTLDWDAVSAPSPHPPN